MGLENINLENRVTFFIREFSSAHYFFSLFHNFFLFHFLLSFPFSSVHFFPILIDGICKQKVRLLVKELKKKRVNCIVCIPQNSALVSNHFNIIGKKFSKKSNSIDSLLIYLRILSRTNSLLAIIAPLIL